MKSVHPDLLNTEAILDSISEPVVMMGLDKKVRYLNQAAERLLGYTWNEAREQSCSSIVRCTACDNDCLLDKAISTGQPIRRYETALFNKNGRMILVSSNMVLLKDKDGQPLGGVEIIRDKSQIEPSAPRPERKYSFENIIGKNHRMQQIYSLLPEVARTDSAVLIEGEPGTGKELVGQAIHQNSPRRDRPFVKVACGDFTDGPLASELFGHLRGAFTGALSDKVGRFQIADHGTLYLDEIGSTSLSIQKQLLRFLKEKTFERVGDHAGSRAEVRLIASTSRDLKTAVDHSEFLGELYDRLRTVTIDLPPLRERRNDIPLLISHFLKRFNAGLEKRIESVSHEAMEVLLNYDYPGNIQELENIIEHAAVLCNGKAILPLHVPKDILEVREDFVQHAIQQTDPLKVVEKQLILKVLSQTGWNYKEAAERLKVSRTTLWRKIKSFGLDRPKSKPSSFH
jgi:PAS domain S-box-containing protein